MPVPLAGLEWGNWPRSEGSRRGSNGSRQAQEEAAPRARRASRRPRDAAQSAARTLDLECDGLQALRAALDRQHEAALRAPPWQTLAAARGRVIVTGIGKSGHIGQKIAATFASTGTPAFFVHPSEASHGDLGMITRDDAIVAISWSGESVELGNILTYSRRFKVPLIAITSRADFDAGQAVRRGAGAAARQGGLPARPGAHDVDHHAARHRRLPGHRAARGQGLHGPRLQGVPPRRLARRQPQVRGRRHAHRRQPAAGGRGQGHDATRSSP